MARIRTIKPEFPQSESMGNVSRDARLLFVLLWTLADDSGRTRGNSRMLASLLFPYDADAADGIEGWLSELEREKCIERYEVEGSNYLEVLNWEGHQKIDKRSAAKYPENPRHTRPEDAPREEPTKAREESGRTLEKSSRIKDQGTGTKDQGPRRGNAPANWEKWKSHLLELGKPLTSMTEEAELMELGRVTLDPRDAKALVEFSIRAGARKLITNGDHRLHGKSRAGPASDVEEWIAQQEGELDAAANVLEPTDVARLEGSHAAK